MWIESTPTTETKQKSEGTKLMWGGNEEKLVNVVLSRHTHAKRIILINHSLKQVLSIKDSERQHGQKNQSTRNVFM